MSWVAQLTSEPASISAWRHVFTTQALGLNPLTVQPAVMPLCFHPSSFPDAQVWRPEEGH